MTGFGQTLTAGLGNLAFNPSPQHPGFEFTITNFSKLLGANPANGLVVMTQDGSVKAVVIGKDELVGVVPQFEAQQIPEPTTWMVWAGLAGGLAWRHRRTRRSPRLASLESGCQRHKRIPAQDSGRSVSLPCSTSARHQRRSPAVSCPTALASPPVRNSPSNRRQAFDPHRRFTRPGRPARRDGNVCGVERFWRSSQLAPA